MTNYTIQGISNTNKLFIIVIFAASMLLASPYSYAQCFSDIVANKTKQNTLANETSFPNVMKSKQQQNQTANNNTQSIQSLSPPLPSSSQQQQLQEEGSEQKTENIRLIATLTNAVDQLTGKGKITVTFNEEDKNNPGTFQSNNKTITAEEEIVFPLTLVKTVSEGEREGEEGQPSTMEVCAIIGGVENTCDTVLLVEDQTKPYKVNLELINFEELEAFEELETVN